MLNDKGINDYSENIKRVLVVRIMVGGGVGLNPTLLKS